MYNQTYDDYIRSILGYPNYNEQDFYQDSNTYSLSHDLDDCYPEIYKIVYPMVQKACQRLSGPITKDKVDRIVEDLYSNIEENEKQKSENNRSYSEVKKETRQFDRGLSDIIRILLLRELLGRPGYPGRPGHRPPFPPPGRPPYPPLGGRPYNRGFDDIYEY